MVLVSIGRPMSARMIRYYTHISTGAARAAVELLDREPILVGEVCGEMPDAKISKSVIH